LHAIHDGIVTAVISCYIDFESPIGTQAAHTTCPGEWAIWLKNSCTQREIEMAGNTEHLSELQRKNMEAAMQLAQLSLENSQRVIALQNELARELFQSGVENARALAAAKDAQEVMRLRTEYAQETARKMMAAAQQVAEIGNEARSAFARLLTEQLAAGSQEMADAFQGFLKSLPGQTPTMLEMMQQAMATANSAFEQIAKATAAGFAGKPEAPQPKSASRKKTS
jgi:phasin family protein